MRENLFAKLFSNLQLGMLTRLARLETQKNFSVSRILFLPVENFRQLPHSIFTIV